MVSMVIITVIVVGFFIDGRVNARGPLAEVQPIPSQAASTQASPIMMQLVSAENVCFTGFCRHNTAGQADISPTFTALTTGLLKLSRPLEHEKPEFELPSGSNLEQPACLSH